MSTVAAQPAAQTYTIAMTEKRPGMAKIRMASGGEEWLKVDERVEVFKNKIPAGALVRLGFKGDTISYILEVDEQGNEKPKAPKTASNGSYSKKADPEAERERNRSILYQSSLKAAVSFYEVVFRHNRELALKLEHPELQHGGKPLTNEDVAVAWNDVLALADHAVNYIQTKAKEGGK